MTQGDFKKENLYFNIPGPSPGFPGIPWDSWRICKELGGGRGGECKDLFDALQCSSRYFKWSSNHFVSTLYFVLPSRITLANVA
jgi:hypothetical protein